LHDALKAWVQLVLAERGPNLQRIREQLTQALGSNAAVLTEFQPDMTLLLGEQPTLPQLGSQETLNRFHRVTQQFIEIITRDQPLVLFLDDLQWADQGTLNFLRVILKAPDRQLLVILSYRDNEVTESHPSLLALRTIQQDLHGTSERSHHLELAPLSLQNLQHLLEDSFHRSENIGPLAQLILDKTAGNPFFVNEFLRKLYSDGLVRFDDDNHQWHWDLDSIRAQGITDNVVELMLEKMRRLPASSYRLLQAAACIGGQFDLVGLAQLEGHSPQATAQLLWPALQEGLLQTLSGDWFTGTPQFELREQPILSGLEAASASYRFLHDRMQQAAYQSLADADRKRMRLAIGRMLKNGTLVDPGHTSLFATVEHLNYSRDLIDSPEERQALAALNSEAAQLAKRACVWAVAARHAALARELLATDAWESNYELAAQIFIQSVECETLNADFDQAEQLAEIALAALRHGEEKARICLVLLNSNIIRGKREYAFSKGVEGLAYCGIKIPPL
ncbi:MAG TPA: AAA family ATPase, partial [Pseudomonadales bacterium]|nr:AAA family ATPase [Pseudomonadales bacterium]